MVAALFVTDARAAEPIKPTDAQTACAVSALTEYTRANLALMGTGAIMPVESQIAQRRLGLLSEVSPLPS